MEMILRRERRGVIAVCPLTLALAFTKEIFKMQYMSYLMVLKINEL